MLESIKRQLAQVKGIVTNPEFQKVVIVAVAQTATLVVVSAVLHGVTTAVTNTVNGYIDARNQQAEVAEEIVTVEPVVEA